MTPAVVFLLSLMVVLQLTAGFKLDLAMRNITCVDSFPADDPVLRKLSCMAKKSSFRANKLAQALKIKQAAAASRSSAITENAPKPTELGTDYESPLASGGGDYVTTISLGTPAEVFTVIADTGSDLIWIQCKPCQACFDQREPIFNPEKSSSYSTMTCRDSMCSALSRKSCSPDCEYSYSYGDGSGSRGTLSSETVTLTTTDRESVEVKKIAFGCGHMNSGSFSDASGLMGLGRGKLSFVSQMGKMFGNKFSYCLVPWRSDSTSAMFFGEAAARFESASGNLRYTPMLKNPIMESFYYVQLKTISVAGRAVDIPAGTLDLKADGSGGIIFDSGTTLTLIQDAAYQSVLKALEAKITGLTRVDSFAGVFDLCYDVSAAKNSYKKRIPKLTFHFASADFELPLENYFITANRAGNVVCLAMGSSGMDIGIFGNLMQQNFHVVYDVEKERIGWAHAECE